MSWYTVKINNKSYILRVGSDPIGPDLVVLVAPLCDYNTDEYSDIKVTNNNTVAVSVYIDGVNRGTLAAGEASWYDVPSFESYYDVQFEYNGQWSPITTAYSGHYESS